MALRLVHDAPAAGVKATPRGLVQWLRRAPARVASPHGRRSLIGGAVLRLAPLTYALTGLRRRHSSTRLVVIVGSVGKTTTTRCVQAALNAPAGRTFGSAAWFSALRVLTDRGRGDAPLVLEVGIERPGQMIAAAAALRPDVALMTWVRGEHISSFKTLDAIAAEKVAMIRAVRSGGVACLNADDPRVRAMRADADGRRVVTYGRAEDADVRVVSSRADESALTTMTIRAGGQIWTARTQLLGEPGVHATVAALAVATALDVPLAGAIARLETVAPTEGRLQPVTSVTGALLIRDDFKSGWDTMITAIETFGALPARRRFAIIGELTEPPPSQNRYYRELGARLARVSDRIIVVGRKSVATSYRQGAAEVAGTTAQVVHVGHAAPDAVAALPPDLGDGDVVLIKGRLVQRFERASLRLTGRKVACTLEFCRTTITCATCPYLERGWPAGRTHYP